MRSWMFVPGNKERYLAKAADSDVDCVLLDLEDGVLPEWKPDARIAVASAMTRSFRPQRYVRLNATSSEWYADDLAEIVPSAPDGVCLPKCEHPDQIIALAHRLSELEAEASIEVGAIRIVAAIETPTAVLGASAIARAHERIVGVLLGAEDLALELGLGTVREGEAADLLFARSMVVYAAAGAGVLSIDGVFPNLNDIDGLETDTLRASRLGFNAKSTFNPRQVEVINRIFSPSPDEVAYAEKVVAAFREAEQRSDASVAVGGQLVDRPIVLRAHRVLQQVEVLSHKEHGNGEVATRLAR